MTYTALELARAAGLFLVSDELLTGVHVRDGVAFIGPDATDQQIAVAAMRAHRPAAPDAELDEQARRLISSPRA